METQNNQQNKKEKMPEKIRDFGLSLMALKNKNTIFILSIAIIAFGIFSYKSLPKELFPEIEIPTVMVQTIYPGNPPIDIENLITRPIEKEIESIKGIKKLSSNSAQDASMIFVEFSTDIEITDALQDVKDAVDKAKSKLPTDLLSDPMVMDIDFSEFPIININLSGDFSIEELKTFGEFLEDEIESVPEISKVELQGINDREIKVNVDPLKLAAFELSLTDIENAIVYENVSISGGEIKLGETRRSVRTNGEFANIGQIENIIVKSEKGNIVYLRDLADVIDGYAESESYARLNQQPVVSLQVIKKGGENLLDATDQIFAILDLARENKSIPDNLRITITNDQSDMIRKQLSNLENSMILGILLVVLVLFFFLGTRNALFVGLAIPMSMFLSFVVLSLLGMKINMIVLFSMILALGMLVDNAIVTVENIYRFIDNGFSKTEAAKRAVGEIAIPIITSTATTLAAFFPLLFWDSIVGEFMKYLPLTLIIVLSSSLFTALVIIPVISSSFAKKDAHLEIPNKKRGLTIAIILIIIGVLFFLGGNNTTGNLSVIFAIIGILNIFIFGRIERWFQKKFLPYLENLYLKLLTYALKGIKPYLFLLGTFLLLILTIMFLNIRKPAVNFFPEGDPNFINIIAELPIGSDIEATNNFIFELEQKVEEVLEPNKRAVKSVLAIVGKGAQGENEFSSGYNPAKGLITINFKDFELREGVNTVQVLKEISEAIIDNYPGVRFTIDKDSGGPPTGKPVNLEISGPDYDKLIALTEDIKFYIEKSGVDGMEGLKMDLNVGKPELLINIDRDKARRFGLSTGQIASTIRTALFGKKVSDYKVGEDEYPIQLRLKDEYRYSVASLMNQKITFRSQSTGKIMQVPISAVADFSYGTTYGSVKRKNLDRIITLYSNVLEGYNATNINTHLKALIENYKIPPGYKYAFTGEQEEQDESMAFLSRALLIALSLILIILVTQFNSLIRPVIILLSVVFSTIGVFGGIATFKMDFVVVMTGIGIISLAGIVVNNAIVLIDYIYLLKKRKRHELGIGEDTFLSAQDATQCIIQGGKTRLRPVLLTAITTILGLIPLAIGLNINFETMLSDFDPQIYFGGDMVKFWGPMSWTVIFGLTFSTFLTLIIVPVMYRISTKTQASLARVFQKTK
ncbi:MAG: efflux RND transporter permease subunit [Bacteroidota bacterium]|nr:efflux RND transporter permease subunit [Bacteroidota bacterium]